MFSDYNINEPRAASVWGSICKGRLAPHTISYMTILLWEGVEGYMTPGEGVEGLSLAYSWLLGSDLCQLTTVTTFFISHHLGILFIYI